MERSIVIEHEYPYTPEEVWEALTEQSSINDWLMHGTFTPKVGAEFEFYWSGTDASNGKTTGKVLELDKPRKISYTWGWGSGETVVTYYLRPTATGTKLRLEHTGFVEGQDEHVYQGALYGWNMNLPRIADAIAKKQSAAA